MGQTATTIPPGKLWRLQLNDFWKSLFLAAIVNVLMTIYPIISAGHWPTQPDLINMLQSTVAIIIGYLIKNLSTNNVGQIFTKDKPTVKVDAGELQDLQDKAEDAK